MGGGGELYTITISWTYRGGGGYIQLSLLVGDTGRGATYYKLGLPRGVGVYIILRWGYKGGGRGGYILLL